LERQLVWGCLFIAIEDIKTTDSSNVIFPLQLL